MEKVASSSCRAADGSIDTYFLFWATAFCSHSASPAALGFAAALTASAQHSTSTQPRSTASSRTAAALTGLFAATFARAQSQPITAARLSQQPVAAPELHSASHNQSTDASIAPPPEHTRPSSLSVSALTAPLHAHHAPQAPAWHPLVKLEQAATVIPPEDLPVPLLTNPPSADLPVDFRTAVQVLTTGLTDASADDAYNDMEDAEYQDFHGNCYQPAPAVHIEQSLCSSPEDPSSSSHDDSDYQMSGESNCQSFESDCDVEADVDGCASEDETASEASSKPKRRGGRQKGGNGRTGQSLTAVLPPCIPSPSGQGLMRGYHKHGPRGWQVRQNVRV